MLSGGTATNDLVPLFEAISSDVTYILPILDNGGSTSEIIRVIGGPAIGDIRSRLTRLIPDHKENLRSLLSFRLDSEPRLARSQWNEIVEGTHTLWNKIPLSTKEIVRSFLVHVHGELLKRSRVSASVSSGQFRYELANVGNLFLTGLRLFIGSLDSAIELFMKITEIDGGTEVLPCINTNFSYHIGAVLANGLIITGQSQISHPSCLDEIYPPPILTTRPLTPTAGISNFAIDTASLQEHEQNSALSQIESDVSSDEDIGNMPLYTHPELKKSQLHFHKTDGIQPLLSPIERVFYVSPYGEEICPTAQSRVISTVTNAKMIIYSIGSLMTSIVPVILLKGIGKAIIQQQSETSKKRILLLNGCEDRETHGLNAEDYVRVIVELAQYSLLKSGNACPTDWGRFMTHVIYMKHPKISVGIEKLGALGIECVEVDRGNGDEFDLKDLQAKLHKIAKSCI